MIAKNLEETQKIAMDFIKNLKPNTDKAVVVGLYGELGAGKTSFAQGVAKELGILENIVSPTFVIMKKYEIVDSSKHVAFRKNLNSKNYLLNAKFTNLIHIDAYRLEKPEELLHLGWQEIISNPQNIILIEWPEKVTDIMPEHIHINFSHISEEGRDVVII